MIVASQMFMYTLYSTPHLYCIYAQFLIYEPVKQDTDSLGAGCLRVNSCALKLNTENV